MSIQSRGIEAMEGLNVAADVKLGRIVAASGSQLVVLLDAVPAGGGAERDASLQLGALVKMHTAVSIVFGIVTGFNIPLPTRQTDQDELELVELDLIGEIAADIGCGPRRFQRGVSIYPCLGEGVFGATQEDLRLVYAAPDVAAMRIGTVHQDPSLPAFMLTDELLGKHFAILGSTGTGKSCAVALILRAILSQHKAGHVVLLDMHNEYAHAFGEAAEVLSPATFDLPYWLLTFEELEELVLSGSQERAEEGPLLGELVLAAKRLFAGDTHRTTPISVDMPVPYRLTDVERLIEQAAGRLNNTADPRLYLRIKARLDALRADPRFAFLFPRVQARDTMVATLSRLFRIPVDGKPLTIIDLASVPSEVLNVVVSVLCRMTFDFALWSERSVPILLVCEEAHRYCPLDNRAGFEPAKRALARIAKEGRKYGLSLCLVSQRPSELLPAVLSQCNTIFALRMINNEDQDYLRGMLRESATGLLNFLPTLRNSEAIIIGEGVAVPVRVRIDDVPVDGRPLSGTAKFSKAWSHDIADPAFLAGVVERWRGART
jgi:DNA helicase HerA-like ATPase